VETEVEGFPISREEYRTRDIAADRRGSVLVGIPAYNEEPTIGSVVLLALKHVDDVVVLDDGSADRTAEVASLAGARVVSHETNKGKAEAVRSLMREARTAGYNTLVLIDGDGQHDPDEIPRLLEMAGNDADIVIGSRHSNQVPLLRRFGRRILDKATSVACGRRFDSQTGFRVLTSRALRLELNGSGFSVESEMLVQAKKAGLTIREVPVGVRYDVGQGKRNPIRQGLQVFGSVVTMVSQHRPLLFFGGLGAIMSLAGLFCGLVVMRAYIETGLVSIPLGLLCVVFIIAGVLSLFSGLMLNLLASIRNSG